MVLSTDPPVVQAGIDPASPTDRWPGRFPDLAIELLPITALTDDDFAALDAYQGAEPIIAVGELAATGDRLFVVPAGWGGAPTDTGTCFITVGEPRGFTPVLCNEGLEEPMLDVDPAGAIRFVGRVPSGTRTVEIQLECPPNAVCLAPWQRTRGGFVFIEVSVEFPTAVWLLARDADGESIDSQEILFGSDGTAYQPVDSPEFDPDLIRHIQAALVDGELDLLMDELAPTPEEVAEAERRNAFKSQLRPTTVRDLIGRDIYGGLWFDSTDGSATVAIADGAELDTVESLLSTFDGAITVIRVRYSYDELSRFYNTLIRRRPRDSSIGLYVTRNMIGIGIDDRDRIDASGIPDDAIFYEKYEGPATAESAET